MAISVDTSVVRWTGTPLTDVDITSGSFIPANNSLLVLCCNMDQAAGNSYTMDLAVAGGGLSWTSRIRRDGAVQINAGAAEIWTAPVTTGASMTITVRRTSDNGGSRRISCKLYIVTGQHATPIGANASGTHTSDPGSATLTATGAGRLFACTTEWNATGAPTSTDTEDSAHYADQISAMSAYKAADHASGSQSIDCNYVGTPAANWVALEILAADASGPSIPVLANHYRMLRDA